MEFDQPVVSKAFVPLEMLEGVFREYDLTGRNAADAGSTISEELKGIDVSGKLVVLRVFGELAGGRASEVGLAGIRSSLSDRGALHVYLNRSALKSRETAGPVISGEEPSTIEWRLFEDEASKVSVSDERLRGESGAKVGIELLRLWRQPPKVGEMKRDYLGRKVREGTHVMESES